MSIREIKLAKVFDVPFCCTGLLLQTEGSFAEELKLATTQDGWTDRSFHLFQELFGDNARRLAFFLFFCTLESDVVFLEDLGAERYGETPEATLMMITREDLERTLSSTYKRKL